MSRSDRQSSVDRSASVSEKVDKICASSDCDAGLGLKPTFEKGKFYLTSSPLREKADLAPPFPIDALWRCYLPAMP